MQQSEIKQGKDVSEKTEHAALEKISAILASEIECGIYETHVHPALEVARKALLEQNEESAVAWMVKGSFTELFADLEEAHKYATTIGEKVIPLYFRAAVAQAGAAQGVPEGWHLIEKRTHFELIHEGVVIASLAGPGSEENAAIIARVLAAAPQPVSAPSTVDAAAVVPKWVWDGMVKTLEPAWDYIQANQEQFGVIAGDDKTAILVDFFLKSVRTESIASDAPAVVQLSEAEHEALVEQIEAICERDSVFMEYDPEVSGRIADIVLEVRPIAAPAVAQEVAKYDSEDVEGVLQWLDEQPQGIGVDLTEDGREITIPTAPAFAAKMLRTLLAHNAAAD